MVGCGGGGGGGGGGGAGDSPIVTCRGRRHTQNHGVEVQLAQAAVALPVDLFKVRAIGAGVRPRSKSKGRHGGFCWVGCERKKRTTKRGEKGTGVLFL